MKPSREMPQQKTFARTMRKQMTDAERKLWYLLRDRRFIGYKFRHQVPIGAYIADFCCISEWLIIEADGSQHVDNNRDLKRDRWFIDNGFRVLRFWNNDIMYRSQSIEEAIWNELRR